MKPLHRKILYVVLWYLVYPQLWYLYLIPELFFDTRNILSFSAIIITYLVGLIDTYFRPFSLARFGSGVLHIEDDHRLITTGVFGYIRHPVYAGGILGLVGIYMAFRSVVMLVLVSLLYFIVIRHRMLFEEEMLVEEFGDEYREYMERTSRLIPFLY